MIKTFAIPTDALDLMTTKRPDQAYRQLIDSGALPLLELLTFAYLNTPISNGPIYDHDRIIAYVSYWDGGHLTVCALDGDMVRLIATEDGAPPSEPEQALAIFKRHWPA